MDIADLAASALKKLAVHTGKKLKKAGPAPEIPEAVPFISDDPDGVYYCGSGESVIMPGDVTKTKYYIAGYRMDHRVTGVLDDLTARAMWLGCSENDGILLVSIDTIGLTGADSDKIKLRVSSRLGGLDVSRIHLSCTHSHASFDTVGYWGRLFPPETGVNKEYMKILTDGVVDAAQQAFESRTPGKLYFGSVHVPEAISKGRFEHPSNDLLTRFRFVPDDGGKEVWLLNFSAHPNTLGGDNTLISADYPRFIRDRVAEESDAEVLFVVGAIASVNIADLGTEDRLERTEKGGRLLAEAALGMSDEQLPASILMLTQKYDAPIDNYVLAFMAIIKMCSSVKVRSDVSSTGIALRTQMTYLKLGGKRILMLPGEAFTELIYGGYVGAEESATGRGPEENPQPLAEMINDPELIVFGVTDDMTGYMVPPNDAVLHPTQAYLSSAHDRFDRNHYHETNGLGNLIPQTVSEVFGKIIEKTEK